MTKYKTQLSLVAAFVVTLLIAFTASAFAAGAVLPEDGSLLDLARPVYEAVMAGQYLAAVCLALILSVALLKRYAGDGKLGAFVRSDLGGMITTFVMASAGALASASLAGASWSLTLLKMGAGVGVAAIGAYKVIKILLSSLTSASWYQKAPTWVKAAMGALLWVVDKREPVKVAEAAGEQAVKDNPPTGADGVTGGPTEL